MIMSETAPKQPDTAPLEQAIAESAHRLQNPTEHAAMWADAGGKILGMAGVPDVPAETAALAKNKHSLQVVEAHGVTMPVSTPQQERVRLNAEATRKKILGR